jgi:large subunit ribosomal protein L31e
MAKEKKKEKEKKIVLERKYTINVRHDIIRVPQYKRAKKAITGIREFLVRHMKSDNIKIGKYLNLKVWEHGIKNPAIRYKIIAKKDEEGKVTAEIEGAPVELPPEPAKKIVRKKKETSEEKIEEEFKKIEEKTEKIHEEKEKEAKEIQKEEIKELKREHPKQHAPKEMAGQKNVGAHALAPSERSEERKP